MKKILGIFVLSIFCCLTNAQGVYVQPILIDSLYYEFDSEHLTAKVVGWQEKAYQMNSVSIPDTVTYSSNKYLVTEIGPGAFYNKVYMYSITIPNSMRIIGAGAFAGTCVNEIYVPANVDSIGGNLYGQSNYYTQRQVKLRVDPNNIKFDSRDDCNAIIETASQKLVCGSWRTRIPDGVKIIGSEAFSYTAGLDEIDIPNSVEIIGKAAFVGCKDLKQVNLGTGVRVIEEKAFCGTTLDQIELFENIERIDTLAFSRVSIDYYKMLSKGIICHALVPPYLNVSIFTCVNDTVHLYVPSESISEYQTDSIWSRFVNIYSIESLPQKSKKSSYAGRLNGVFSVSPTRKVVFSSGNLQYNYKNPAWRLASHQYENLSIDSSYAEGYDINKWIQLFSRSTTENYYGAQATKSSCESGQFVDWGSIYGADWRVLKGNEFQYLLQERDNANLLYGFACIEGINGCVFLPDDWVCPSDITFNPGVSMSAVLYNSTFVEHNSYTFEEWKVMEDAGAVFLPASGYNDSYYRGNNKYGYYWCVTNSSYKSDCLSFYPDVVDVNTGTTQGGTRVSDAISVRLVHDYKFYNLYAETDGNGSVVVSHYSAMAGDTIHYSVSPNEHYRFKKWEILAGSIGITDSCFVMYADSVVLKAIFEPIPVYSITIANSVGGYAEADYEEAEEGTLVTLSVYPDDLYEFVAWEVVEGNVSISNNSFTMPDCNVELAPIFRKNDIGQGIEDTLHKNEIPLKILNEKGVHIVTIDGKSYLIDGKSE